jgi:hypothetical protein
VEQEYFSRENLHGRSPSFIGCDRHRETKVSQAYLRVTMMMIGAQLLSATMIIKKSKKARKKERNGQGRIIEIEKRLCGHPSRSC